MNYIVVIKDDNHEYVLATRSVFDNHTLAVHYANSCALSREPIIVAYPLDEVLQDFKERHPVLYEAYCKR
jgi:hypothetical protein